MHRFRRKSDAKRGQVPTAHTLTSSSQGILPELPPSDDFRTSLILPDLSRRFSLLRSATGESVPVEQLKTRLANHRKQGSEHQISEEEEDMLLETLNRLRSRVTSTTSAEESQEQLAPTQDSAQESTLSSSITSSSSRSAKRYSNQLFGSGRLRDYTHTKSSPSKTSRTSARTTSITSTDSQAQETQDSSRPVTPYTDGPVSSAQSSSVTDVALPTRSDSLSPYDVEEDDHTQSISVAEYRLNMALGPNVFKRASIAIQQAIKEIEDEVEEEILLPRSTPIPRGSIDQYIHSPEVRNSQASVYESAMAISSDRALPDEFRERRASPILTRTVPGYVPGMPRPMTPRDFDFDEQRSHSTTPRAQSPYADLPTSPALSMNKLRRESLSSGKPSAMSPVSAAPYFLQRSANAGSFGRSTPEDLHRTGNGDSVDLSDSMSSSMSSSILSRRRPVSPLSSPPYQPMAASNIRPPSRPTTPSNVIWTPNPNQTHRSNGSHSRNNSWTGEGSLSNSDYPSVFSSNAKFGPRPLRSPRNDRFDFSPGSSQSSSASSPPNGIRAAADSPRAYIPDADAGSPTFPSKYTSRSDTPTQNAQYAQASPAFATFDSSPRNGSKRASRQTGPSSPFNLNGFSSLGFAPRPSSSRSSLDSVGSSFHSWDESDKVLSLFADSKDPQSTAWHDFSDNTSHSTPGTSPPQDDDDEDANQILQQHGGLRTTDLAVIQNKLVYAALTKIANTDPRDRAPSAMRRSRRPSTSQSNYPRVASPPPQPASPTPFTNEDHISKASALLNSVVDSIKDQPHNLTVNPATPTTVANLTEDTQSSPNSKRNLTFVLFGADDEVNIDEDTVKFTPQASVQASAPISTKGAVAVSTPAEPPLPPPTPTPTTSKPQENAASPAYVTPYLLRNPSTSRIPKNTHDEADLAREVKQKTDAAMVALNKNPSHANLGDSLKHSPSIRRRVDPSQISTPKLVSTTTSVETVPIRTPSLSSNNAGSSKLGSRFKKLRGSLRVKNTVSPGEDTAVDSTKSSSTNQLATHDSSQLNSAGTPKSATESGRFKVPVAPSPPASAGPGLKGFMARFRNKRTTEMSATSESSTGTSSSQQARAMSPLSPRFKDPISPTTPTAPKHQTGPTERGSVPSSPRAPGQPRPMYSRFPPANLSAPLDPPTEAAATEASQSETALEQLFKAANNLGLDQKALTELLARSGATAAQPASSRQDTTIAPIIDSTSRKESSHIQQVAYVGSTGSDQTATPTNYTSLANEQRKKGSTADLQSTTPDESISRKGSVRKADHLRKPKENPGDPVANAIVRRTLIYANDIGSTAEFSALMQRKNSARRRRASANSVSVRSIQDRAPTPPPPKSSKRFSADGMPPMPQMPNFSGAAGQMLNVPTTSVSGAIEKSNSTYDSLYDMYAGESRVASVVAVDPNAHADQQTRGDLFESGPALELVELANGETIWNIVNNLRDGDDESIYSGRASFTSEYSTREPGSDFVKDHSRSGSKASATSFISKKKAQSSQQQPQQGKLRPETKVFHSTSAQIGRLIESLSQGADAGSFNFLPSGPGHGPGHSASSSLSTNDINWTVEERLERMLGAMATP